MNGHGIGITISSSTGAQYTYRVFAMHHHSYENSTCVSVLIPCYNAARWIAEAIESCLAQTYKDVEVIVVDDGSHDNSVEVIMRYSDRVHLITQRHQGANRARNQALAYASGNFIQFLDADDYLLPNKIEHQVTFLRETQADVVYGDWRYQFHRTDGSVQLGSVQIAGEQQDILRSLLSNWWVAPGSLLFCRELIDKTQGWDESLEAAQDRDFILSAVMEGARVVYQPGCGAIYRRYGNTSLTQSNRQRWLLNHMLVCEKIEKRLASENRLIPVYRSALAHSYFFLARHYYSRDRKVAFQLHDKVLALDPHFEPHQSRAYNFIYGFLGFSTAENTALVVRGLRSISGKVLPTVGSTK